MSSAFPAGGPSKISVNTTSASSKSTIRCAVVDPTNPPPTTVTFFLLIPLLVVFEFLCATSAHSASLRYPFLLFFSFLLPRHSRSLHVLDDCGSKRRGPHLCSAGHQSLKVIRHALLLNRPRNPIFNQLSRFLPSQKLKHHRAR